MRVRLFVPDCHLSGLALQCHGPHARVYVYNTYMMYTPQHQDIKENPAGLHCWQRAERGRTDLAFMGYRMGRSGAPQSPRNCVSHLCLLSERRVRGSDLSDHVRESFHGLRCRHRLGKHIFLLNLDPPSL